MPPKRKLRASKSKINKQQPPKRRKKTMQTLSSEEEEESFDSDSEEEEEEEEEEEDEEEDEEEEEESVLLPRTSKFTDVDRAFIQRLMASSVLVESEMEDLLDQVSKQFSPKSEKDPDLQKTIKKINKSLIKHAGFEIVKRKNDSLGEIYYGIANTDGDDVAEKYASSFEPWELELLRSIIQIIVTKEQGCITQEELTAEYNVMQVKYKKNVYESKLTVEHFCQQKWLASDDQGICLGPRSFLEVTDELFQLGAAKCSKTNQLVIKNRSLHQFKNHFKYFQAVEQEEEQ